jgi:hypothetical protein
MATDQAKVTEAVEVDEKVSTFETAHLEHSIQAGISHEDAHFLHDFDEKEHQKIYRKVDYRLMPMLMALYLIANLDRYGKELAEKERERENANTDVGLLELISEMLRSRVWRRT